jgi:beta-glucosidase
MPGDENTSWKEVKEAIERGDITEEELETSLKRVCQALEKAKKQKPQKETDKALLGKLSAESMVLLKNDGDILPLSDERVVVIGGLATQPCVQGGGCASIESENNDAPYAEFCKRVGYDVPYATGYSIHNAERVPLWEGEAVEKTKEGNVILYFMGLPSYAESEGYDRKTLSLPENQLVLLEKLAATGKKIIVVLTNGAAVELGKVEKFASAILECWYAGDAYAKSCCDVLFGEINPSGRLSETLPFALSDYFPHDYHVDKNDNVRYKEGENVGYKYYALMGRKSCYPFGYGLSYTQFVYDKMAISAPTNGDSELSVEVNLRNIGKRAGKEVVQVYLRHELDDVPSLAGFLKVQLEAGESKTVRVDLDKECFTKYNASLKKYALRTGKYEISVRKNAEESIAEKVVEIGKRFECTRYTKIGELIKVGNGPELIAKYLSKYICKAVLDDSSYHMRFKGREIDEELFSKTLRIPSRCIFSQP